MNFPAIVLVHLGGVEKIGRAECADFLREFLADREVMGGNFFARKIFVPLVSRLRAGRFCAALKSCAINRGGELKQASVFYAESLAQKLSEKTGAQVFQAGVYGKKNLKNLRGELERKNLLRGKILFLICYPQIASSTVFPALREIEKNFAGADYEIVKGYGHSGFYARAIANSVSQNGGKFDALLVLFHSAPKPQLKKFDYQKECEKSFELIRGHFGGIRAEMAYQSAMKFGEWLGPSAEQAALRLARGGAKNLAVVCPGFFCDCTETLVEIGRDLRRAFLAGGGENFTYINCLNDSPLQVNMFFEIIKEACSQYGIVA
ncbi:MAG: ferrochelatase [Opitutales bacterium]|nr:ferrochelatase [Opitutales bacterium]